MPSFRAPDLIAKKRDGCSLTDEELEQFVQGVVNGKVTDAQTGAMLMAIYLRGLDDRETAKLTSSMLESGDVLSWPAAWRGKVVDKHSTGGVGEKTSLILAPVLAACGLKVPMISGRGLGHTGGTLDKLEAIPGFRASISMQEMQSQLATVGGFIVGPTKEMVPADKVLYATRDVTSTVANKSLIAASIMSKKLAESLDALVILLTYGSAAFMKTEKDARALSRILIDIGRRKGIKVSCMLMTMDDPLGRTVGNALEVWEAIQCLNGQGPADLMDVVCQLGAQLLVACGQVDTPERGHQMVDKVIKDGSAKCKFVDIAVAQGAHRDLAEKMFTKDVENILPKSSNVTNITADETGFAHGIDAMAFGTLCHKLGAGRTKPTDNIDMGVGVELSVTVGDYINKGDPWVKVHHEGALTADQVSLIKTALTVGPDLPPAYRMTRVTDVLH